MAYRVLEVTIQSAKDLKRVNLITRMEVYAVVTISGDPLTRQCTPPDPYGGRNPCWNSTFRFNVPPSATSANGCLHVLLRTERALGDRDVGEVIIPLADILAGATATDPGPRPQQCASYTIRKVHRCEQRGTLNVSYRLGPVVAPQAPARSGDEHGGPVVAYPFPSPRQFVYPAPYGYLPPMLSLPPPPQATQATAGGGHAVNAYNNNFPAAYSQAAAAGGHDGAVGHPPPPAPSSGYADNTYGNNHPAAYSQAAAAGYAAPPTNKGNNKSSGDSSKVDFGVGLGAGLVSGAIGGMLASDMMAEAAAYTYGYRAGLADGGGGMAVYKNSRVVPPNKVQDKVEPKRTTMV